MIEAPEDVGTYNFASPTEDGLGHFQKDVLPWIFWENSPEDTTTIKERLNAFIIDGVQEKASKLIFGDN